MSGELTIFSDSPVGDYIGHAFIGVTENGTTTHIGQWPGGEGFGKGDIGSILVSDMSGTLVSPDISHLVDQIGEEINKFNIFIETSNLKIYDLYIENGEGDFKIH